MTRAMIGLFLAFAGLALLAGTSPLQKALDARQQPKPDAAKALADALELQRLQAAQAAAKAKLDALQKPAKQAEPPEKGRGYVPLSPERLKHLLAVSTAKHGDKLAMMAAFQALPASFDCRERIPLPIWDQGPCGSCYLDSTVRTFTCAGIYVGLGKSDDSFKLAVQYGMDRPRDFGGCDGGNGTEVADWIHKNGWIAETYVDLQGVVHNDYPAYEARSGSDRTKAGAKIWAKGWDWGFVTNGKLSANGKHLAAAPVEQIKAALYNYGRLNIAIDAGGQFGNGTGTITALGDGIDHEINVAGYDDNKDGGSWLLENQWSKNWGIGGYRWCTYAAGKHIVDWFFVAAGPQPLPPTAIVVTMSGGAAQIGIPYMAMPIATGGTAPYMWMHDFGDGMPPHTANTHTYTTAGTYTITAAATDAKGATGKATAAVVVSTGPPIPPTPGPYPSVMIEKPGLHFLIRAEQLKAVQDKADLLDKLLDLLRKAPPQQSRLELPPPAALNWYTDVYGGRLK